MILYTFRRCPYAMRARMALAAAKIPFEPREILLKDKPKSLLEYSPKGTVPVLVLDDGTVIDESLDVMLWSLVREGCEDFFPQTEAEKNFALNQVKVNDFEFKKHLDVCKYSIRYTAEEFSEAKEKAHSILLEWNNLLSQKTYFHGDCFGFLDMALLPFIRQFAGIKPDLFYELEAPELKKWFAQTLENKFFEESMIKYPLYSE